MYAQAAHSAASGRSGLLAGRGRQGVRARQQDVRHPHGYWQLSGVHGMPYIDILATWHGVRCQALASPDAKLFVHCSLSSVKMVRSGLCIDRRRPHRLAANLPQDALEQLPADFETGIYLGWASINGAGA